MLLNIHLFGIPHFEQQFGDLSPLYNVNRCQKIMLYFTRANLKKPVCKILPWRLESYLRKNTKPKNKQSTSTLSKTVPKSRGFTKKAHIN